MNIDPWGNELDEGSNGYHGIFAIRKSLDGELAAEFIDKKRFIGVKIANEEFLVGIESINEIIMLPNITFVPHSAKYIEGVINLRGTILPVINVRKMMGLPKGSPTVSTRVIICRDETVNVKLGILVDSITRVVALGPDDIDLSAPPSAASGHELLTGVSKHSTPVCGIMSLEKILVIASDGKTIVAEDHTDAEHHEAG